MRGGKRFPATLMLDSTAIQVASAVSSICPPVAVRLQPGNADPEAYTENRLSTARDTATANQRVSNTPVWHDSNDPSICLSRRQLGWKAGEVVLIFTPNHLLVPVTYLGVVGSKRVFSGVNPIYTIPEVTHQIQNTEAKVVLVHPTLVDTVLAAAQKAVFPHNRLFQFADAPCPRQKGVEDWESMLGSDAEANVYRWPELHGEQSAQTVATINYSSGTIGLPKGVCVSHRNLIANAEQIIFMRDH